MCWCRHNNSISHPKSRLPDVIEYATNAIRNAIRIARRTFIIVDSCTIADTTCFLLESIVFLVAASCAARLRYILRRAASNSGGYSARIFLSCDNSLVTSCFENKWFVISVSWCRLFRFQTSNRSAKNKSMSMHLVVPGSTNRPVKSPPCCCCPSRKGYSLLSTRRFFCE